MGVKDTDGSNETNAHSEHSWWEKVEQNTQLIPYSAAFRYLALFHNALSIVMDVCL